ncbi:MAG TPA: prolyl oligopeptidase family serine peptidase [Puia sp.]|nr:prolyl oligopeptidase family serine peptidase [Puia sp.]
MRRSLLLLLLPLHIMAQSDSFRPFKKYPFTSGLVSSPKGSAIAWTMDEEGRRNIYVAGAPDFKPKMITAFSKDDGQEITSLSISGDGRWVIFVRGGDHGANWDSEMPVNPAFDTEPFKVQVASVPFEGGTVKYLSEGDDPIISPDSKEVAFIKNGQAWSAPIDGAAAAKSLFTTRGRVGSLKWSADGRRLLFVSSRTDHSIIGIYTKGNATLKWIAPSFSRDASPQWSGDDSHIAFIRRPGAGGAPDSILTAKPDRWSIYIADTATGIANLLWKSPPTLRGSYPTTDGGANLHWAAGDRIVFLSYQDGWPHLYSIDASSKDLLLLTPGNFMCEHIKLSPDGRKLIFSANTGPDQHDIERRHVAIVSVGKPDMQIMTPGTGLEWTPTITGDGNTLAFISATPQRPPLPAIMTLNDRYTSIKTLAADRIPADFPQDKLVTPTAVTFQSADGFIIHADLFLPPAGVARKPAIVYVHGGPPRQMLLGWHYSDYYSNAYASNQHLASLGFVVLSVNYRLGIGYGYEFHKPRNAGAAGASEYRDIKAAGRWLRQQPFVDTNKIGIYGGSYGGYLTALALARDSKLFSAGVDFHGVHDWLGQTSLYSTFKDSYEKAPDYDKALKTAWQSSPVASMNTWKSPVLVIQGDDDRNVRFNQSVDLVRRLESKGIPYETLVIVDDTHHWMNFDNAVTVYAAAADFFIRKFMK